MKKFTLTLLVTLLAGMQMLLAQDLRVTGIVSDASGAPLPGVTVVVEGTSRGTTTLVDGTYVIPAPANATLRFSFVGMVPVTVPVNNRTTINVVLESDTQLIDDVIVVAYGTTQKGTFTGSAEVISSDKLATRPVANVTKALDGMVAGLMTTSGGGQPGSTSAVRIRGFGSINASQAPLYVVDGMPFDGDMNSINPNDIDQVSILKDASAGALYGARGANGVIIITTKRGNTDKVNVHFKATVGVSSRAIPEYEMMDEKGFIEYSYNRYRNDEIFNNGVDPSLAGNAALEAMTNGTNKLFGENEQYNPYNYPIRELIDPATGKIRSDATLKWSENWIDEATAKNPIRQEYSVSVTSGNEKTKSMFSMGYLSEEGLLTTTKFERFSGRLNVDSNITPWLSAGLSSNFSLNKQNFLGHSGTAAISNVWYSARNVGPIYPLYLRNADGSLDLDDNNEKQFDWGENRPAGAEKNSNAIAMLYDDKYSTQSDNASGTGYINLGGLTEGPLRGLNFRTSLGFNLRNINQSQYYNPYFGNSASVNGMIQKINQRVFTYTFNQILTWNRSFDVHNFDLMAGHEFYSLDNNYLRGDKTGFAFPNQYELDAAATVSGASSYLKEYRVEGYFARLNYNYDDKYYISGSFRRDGSSRFHPDHRWGNFWSVGANWRISQESFLKNVSWINNLSLKASYGIQGNDDALDSDSLSDYYLWQSLYQLIANAQNNGALISSLENTMISWEKNANLNIGIEARLFNRLSATIEYYQRSSQDMLMNYPKATSTGFSSLMKNVGDMRNSGFDITLNGQIVNTPNFSWDLTLIGSTVKNKVTKIPDGKEIVSGISLIREGEELRSFYVVRSAGVDPLNGDQLYWAWETDDDGNRGDSFITNERSLATECKEIIGSRIPDIYGSVQNSFRFLNGFDASFMFTYSIGGKVYDGVYQGLMNQLYVGQNVSKHLERAWSQPGDVTDVPRPMLSSGRLATTDDFVDASYLSLKNISIGYTLPTKWFTGSGIQSVRLSAVADNVFIATKLKGMDPQYNFTGGTSYTYKPARTISFSLDLNF